MPAAPTHHLKMMTAVTTPAAAAAPNAPQAPVALLRALTSSARVGAAAVVGVTFW
jgi:hypothetical protein